MHTHGFKFKILLGAFIAGGLALFVFAVFIIGKQKNMFNPVFNVSSTFHNVSGLQVGNNVRFSGINVGTVDNIQIINDSTVRVNMIIQQEVQQFIKTDCKASIGAEGIIGDRVIMISQSGSNAPIVTNGQSLASSEPIETDAIFSKLKVTVDNTTIISDQLAEIFQKINNGNGILGKLIQDSTIAENINQTIVNLKKSSKGLDENMNAAKNNFLLRGYFKKKEKEDALKKAGKNIVPPPKETKRQARRREAKLKETEAQKAIDINTNN